jgi:CRISPR-associated protein Cas2
LTGLQTKELVVVCYDVADEKRRRLIADTLENFGVQVQDSAFECFIDTDSLSRLSL